MKPIRYRVTGMAISLAIVTVAVFMQPAGIALAGITPTATNPPADTPVPAPTDTPVPAPTDTPVPAPTDTPVSPPTDTPVPPATDTPADTPVPPVTDTPAPPPADKNPQDQRQDNTATATPIPTPEAIPELGIGPGATEVAAMGSGLLLALLGLAVAWWRLWHLYQRGN